jgi:DHA1 family tetracycline resistance protein-like MFS transporter
VMQFVSSPVLGVLSDRIGRRPVIVLSTLGLGLDYVLMALAPSLPWLFVGRVISGITSANTATAGAYIADVVPAEKRAASFGLLGAAFGIGFVVGPAVGGLLGAISPRLPFWFAAGLSIANALYGALVLPESLPRDLRRPFAWSRANPIGSLALLRSHRELFGLAGVMFLSVFAGACLPSVYVLYTTYRYAWDERTVGLSLALVGICSVVVQALLMKPIVARFGERLSLAAGLLCGGLGMAIYGFAPNGFAFSLGTPILMLWGLSSAAQSMMTHRVGPSEQGELQGAIGSLRGVATLAGPALFPLTFAAAIGPLRNLGVPGAPWFLAAAMLVGSMLLALAVTRGYTVATEGTEATAA